MYPRMGWACVFEDRVNLCIRGWGRPMYQRMGWACVSEDGMG